MAALSCGALVLGMALAAPAALAASDDQQHGSASGGAGGAAAGAAGTNGSAGKDVNRTDLTTCMPGQVWDAKKHKCLERHSGVLPDSELTEYANALLKADRFEEAIDVLDLLDDPNTPAPSTIAAMRPAGWDAPTKGSATIFSRSRSIPLTRRCANILAKPM